MQDDHRLDRKRRLVMQGLGSAALALPALQYFEPRARAAAPGRAKFIVFMYTANGTDPENFFPTESGTGFNLSPILQPLGPFKDKLLILGPKSSTSLDGTGLAHYPDIDPKTPPEQNDLLDITHQTHVCLTGDGQPHRQVANGDYGTVYPCRGPSIDQVIASKIYLTPPQFPSLQLGVHSVPQQGSSTLSFTLEGQPMRRETNPRDMWSRIFGAPVQGQPDPIFEARQKRRLTVSNFLHKRFSSLLKSKKLGSADRAIFDHHLSALTDTEKLLFAAATQPAGANCTQPSFGPVPPVPVVAMRSYNDSGATALDYADTPAVTTNMLALVTSAFACDLTRVVALSMSYEGGDLSGGIRAAWLGADEPHHALSHYDPSMMPDGRDHWNKLDRWFAQQLADLLDRLQKTPYGAGTLLDQTIVYWVMRHGHGGGHENYRLGNVIVDGSGYFRTGRFLRLPETNHNELLISLANAMGVDLAKFGVNRPATGPLPGLT